MKPCQNPRVCGVQNHKEGTICEAEVSAYIGRATNAENRIGAVPTLAADDPVHDDESIDFQDQGDHLIMSGETESGHEFRAYHYYGDEGFTVTDGEEHMSEYDRVHTQTILDRELFLHKNPEAVDAVIEAQRKRGLGKKDK